MGKHLIIDLIRHADAAKVPLIEDINRPLSQTGIEQAVAAQAAYVADSLRVKLAIHSPAPRAYLTQMIVLGAGRPALRVLPGMWPPESDPLTPAFEQHGYDVAAYLRDVKAAAALNEYGRKIAHEIWATPCGDGDGIVHVAGHAVLQNALAYHLSLYPDKGGGEGDMSVFDYEMAPCSRLRLTFEGLEYRGCSYHPL
jgi:hypothetical protein